MSFIEIKVPQKFTNTDGLLKIPDISTGLVLDFDADTITALSGGTVQAWDSSGTTQFRLDNTAGAYTRPTLTMTGPAGHRAVKFSGTSSLYGSYTGDLIPPSGDITVAVVMKTDPSSVTGRLISTRPESGTGHNLLQVQSNQALAGDGTGATIRGGGWQTPGEWGFMLLRIGNAGAKIEASWGTPGEGALQMMGMRDIFIGSSSTGGTGFHGDIARIMIFDRELPDDDAVALMSYLSTVYEIAG